nr:PREDICTED: uncharacterized protein LOC108197702 [Daucus carota subsp. sativus]
MLGSVLTKSASLWFPVMQSSGLVAAKFCWKLNSSDTKSNDLTLPTAFHSKYGDRLLDTVDMRLRNGYVVPLKLDKSRGVLSGFLVFFLNFELKGGRGGDLLVFEYFGQYHINAHILSANGSEMRYPKRVRQIELCYPPLMTLGEDGWRFVKFQSDFDCNVDEIKPPAQFLARCEFALPEEIMYVISNGKTFHGSYCTAEKKLTGLSQLCEIVGVSDLSGFEMMLFEYQVPSTLNISIFDEILNEIIFPGTSLSIGRHLFNLSIWLLNFGVNIMFELTIVQHCV